MNRLFEQPVSCPPGVGPTPSNQRKLGAGLLKRPIFFGENVADEFIEKDWPENYGRAWVELLESGLSEHARMCYVAMTSFGKESRAGKRAIQRRMGVKSLTTVKAAQAELLKAGWIILKRAGTVTTPNHWKMVSKVTLGHTAPQGGAQGDLGLGRTAPPKQEDKHEDKQERDTADAEKEAKKAKGLAIGALLGTFKKIWDVQFKDSYKANGQDAKAAVRLIEAGVTPENLEVRALQFVNSADPWIRARGHAFWVLELKWVEFRAVKPQGNKPEFEG